MNVKLFRLSTGEDLIGDVISRDDKELVIENPCIVYLAQNPENPTGPARLGMTRWMPYAENIKFSIKDSYLVTEATPAEDLVKQYDSVFGVGLIVPNQSIALS